MRKELLATPVLMALLVSPVKADPYDALDPENSLQEGEIPPELVEVCEPIKHPEGKKPLSFLVGKEVCYMQIKGASNGR